MLDNKSLYTTISCLSFRPQSEIVQRYFVRCFSLTTYRLNNAQNSMLNALGKSLLNLGIWWRLTIPDLHFKKRDDISVSEMLHSQSTEKEIIKRRYIGIIYLASIFEASVADHVVLMENTGLLSLVYDSCDPNLMMLSSGALLNCGWTDALEKRIIET